MVDIVDYLDDVRGFVSDERHGLAALARYKHERKLTGQVSEQSLEYFDQFADTLLKIVRKEQFDIKTAFDRPELQLRYPNTGRPKADLSLTNHTEVRKKKAFKAALHRRMLIDKGETAADADESTLKLFGYQDTRTLRAAAKKFEQHIEYHIQHEQELVANTEKMRLLSVSFATEFQKMSALILAGALAEILEIQNDQDSLTDMWKEPEP